MTQPEVLDQNIRALQEWLRNAWVQLGDPAMPPLSRRELRSQMKQCSADLRSQLELAATRQSLPVKGHTLSFSKPELRILT